MHLRRRHFAFLASLGAWSGTGQAAATSAVAEAMRSAAGQLLARTTTAQRQRLLQAFTFEAREDWSYVPRSRPCIPFKDMAAPQRQAAQALLAAALSESGLLKVRAVIALEIVLRELESSGPARDPENYAIALFGLPEAQGAWGWRIEGHHLSLHFTLSGGEVVATLPQFMGANPANVKGQRVLAEEEDRAFALLRSLSPAQRARAVFSERPFGDIVTRSAGKLDPLQPVGIAFGELEPGSQALLLRLVDAFASVVEPSLTEQRLARVRAGGLDAIRFGWAGSQAPGGPYYYRVQGPQFLIELDNSGGNHIHSVWRDFRGDWGRDALGEHYRRAGGGKHRH